jgi:hypothetical protein
MNHPQTLQRLGDLDCLVTVGRHKSKIDAVNGGRIDDWSILVLASDDMVPVTAGYDQRIIEEMDRHFPLRDGAIYFNDGYNKEHAGEGFPVLCTLPIFGRHLWEEFGYVYFPEYGSLYSDTEQTDLLTAMRRLVFVDEMLIEHRHHAAGKAAHDAMYKFNDDKWGSADKELYIKRRALRRPGSQFAFDAPPLLLSILICSTHKRAPYLRRLLAWLRGQVRDDGFHRQVEICVDIDNGELSVGQKRQKLLERAVGHYVAFVDDDDLVASDYLRRILGALKDHPTTDCLSLVGVMTTDGEQPERFEHSVSFDGWYTREGVHYRTPNHLSVVRRDLAIKVGFINKSVGEDHDYSSRLRPLLKTEASTGTAPLYYYLFVPHNSVQQGGA